MTLTNLPVFLLKIVFPQLWQKNRKYIVGMKNMYFERRSRYWPGWVMIAAISPGRMRGEGRKPKPAPTFENWKS